MYIPMTIGGKKYTETSLWTNPSPTSTFASQTVSLSESIENFEYIKVKFKYANGYDIYSSPIVLVSEFKTFKADSQRSGLGTGGIFDASNNMYSRCYWYINNTSVQFGAAYRLNSTTAYNDNLIPIEILGLNELDHGIMGADLLWTNSDPSSGSGFAAQTVSLDLSDYDAIILRTAAIYSTIPTTFPTSSGDQILIPKENVGDIGFGYYIQSNNYYVTHRTVSVSDSGVTFGNGCQNTQTALPTRAVPLAIYGVKNSIP